MSLAVTQLVGFGCKRASAASGPSLSYQSSNNTNTSATSHTFTSQSIGAEGANRAIVVVVGYYTGASATLSSATIGGTSATITNQVLGTSNGSAIIIAAVSSGTTATIVLNWSANAQGISVAVYRVVDLVSVTAHASSTDTGTPASLTVNVPANGIIIAGSATIDGSPTVPSSWVGPVGDGSQTVGGASAAAWASNSYASAQTPLTVSVTVPGSRSSLVAASWGN